MLTVMKPCAVGLLANSTDVERSFTTINTHPYRQAQARMHIYTHDDLVMERFGCDPGDSWGHEAQLTGYEKYARRRASANMVDVLLRFRNDKMDHCQCS